MARILTAIGALIVLLFTAAAAAPYVVDWNRYKPAFEREASRVLGVPVLVDGRMEFGFLPSPVMRLEGARLGSRGLEARIASVQLELSVGALLRGEIDVVEARLIEPKLWLALDREGHLVGAGLAEGAVDLASVALRRVDIEGGEITVEGAGEETRLYLDRLAFGGEATSLAGPWRLEGGGRIEGRPVGFNLATGRAEGQGLRLRLLVEPLEAAVATEFDGEITIAERRPVATGLLRLRGIGAADATAREGSWRAEAQIELRPDRLTARDLRLVPAGASERVLEFTGSVMAALGASRRVDAALALRQLDLDRLAGTGSAIPADVPTILRRLAAAPAFLSLPDSDGRLSLDVTSVVLGGGLLQEVKLEAELADGRARLTRLDARLPGQATLKASGQFGLRGGPFLFDGPVEFAVRAPSTFASWLEGELLQPREARAPPPAGAIAVSGRLTASPDRVAITSLSATIGNATVTGEVDLAHGAAPPRLRLRLSAGEVDVEPLIELAGAFAARLSAREFGEIDAALRADRLRLRALDARGIDVALRTGPEGIIAERLRGEVNGLSITGAGRIDPDGAGALNLRLSGARIAPALDAARDMVGAHPLLDALHARAGAIGAVALDATLTRSGATSEIALAGTAGETRIEIGASLLPGPLAMEQLGRLVVTLQAPRAETLLAQLGFDTLPTGEPRAARATLGLERQENGRHRLSLDAHLLGTRIAAAGALALAGATAPDGLAAAISSSDIVPLLLALGRPVADLGEQIPVSMRGRVSFEGEAIRLAALRGTVAGENVEGEIGITRAAVPRISGALNMSALPLERLVGLIAGPWPEPEPGHAWSGAPFGPPPLPAATGAVSIAAGRLLLAGHALRDARLTARLIEGGLMLEGMDGVLAGGRLSGELALTRPEGALRIAGRASVDGARLEELVWRGPQGRAVASGRADLVLTFEGAGRTPAVLIGALAGEGTLKLSRGEIRGVAASGFSAGARAGEAGAELDEARLAELVRREMDAGALAFERVETALSLRAGVLRASNVMLDGAPLAASGRVAIDLPRWMLESDWSIAGEAHRPGARGPRIGLLFQGPMDAPERRIDVRAFVDYLNLRRFEREVERLEAVQRQIEERERILREMERQEHERREREAPRAPPPPTPPDQRSEAPASSPPDTSASGTLDPLPPPIVIGPAPMPPAQPAGPPIRLVPPR